MAAGWGGRIIVIGLVALVRGPARCWAASRRTFSLLLITVLVGGFLWMGATASIQQGPPARAGCTW